MKLHTCLFLEEDMAGLMEATVKIFFVSLVSLQFFRAAGQLDGYDHVLSVSSTNFPSKYPANAQDEWVVDTSQFEQILMSINFLEIEHPWDTLLITHMANQWNASQTFILRSDKVTSLNLPSGYTTIQFCSDVMEENGGFDLDFYAISMNSTRSAAISNVYLCDSGMQSIILSAQCDGIVDCHDYSDETGCGECSMSSYQCHDSDICLAPDLQCDGQVDCPLGDDEEQCHILKCPMGCFCGESPYNDRHGPLQPTCGGYSEWQPMWINCTQGWSKEYARSTTKTASLLNLAGAGTGNLEPQAFSGLKNVHTLDLASNQLFSLTPGVFDGLTRLWKLIVVNNSLTYLESQTFRGLFNLRLLYLDINQINRLNEGCFMDLNNLFFIDLAENNFTSIPPGSFRDLGQSLQRLVISDNSITDINASLFTGIERHLNILNVGGNPLSNIALNTFQNLSQLRNLYIILESETHLPLYPEIFDGLPQIEAIHANDPRICCMVPEGATCIEYEPAHPLFTCRKTFLQNIPIKIFIWILGISALFGNTYVIITRLRSTPTTVVGKVQAILITNLAMSDILMGVYLLILAVMDNVISESYFWEGKSEEWRSSIVCQIAGFFSVLSSETSVFLITVISVDRLSSVVSPFGQRRLGVKSTRVAAALIWIISLLLSAISTLLNYINPDAYSLSDVCVGLPLVRKNINLGAELEENTFAETGLLQYRTVAGSSESTWRFSIALFLGVNLICFSITLFAYAGIFLWVRITRNEAGRQSSARSELGMASKMLLIVGTDFCCWMPIIVLGILVQADIITLSPDVYAWLVVFVLPINSSINPYLYTFIHRMSQGKKKTTQNTANTVSTVNTAVK